MGRGKVELFADGAVHHEARQRSLRERVPDFDVPAFALDVVAFDVDALELPLLAFELLERVRAFAGRPDDEDAGVAVPALPSRISSTLLRSRPS